MYYDKQSPNYDEENISSSKKSKPTPGHLNNNDALVNEINKLKKIKKRIRSLEDNEGKWNQIEKNVKENEEKIDQMSKTMNDMVRNQIDEGMNRSALTQTIEYEKMVQENVTLKADTLIFREDITHLSQVNSKLESELEIARAKVLELLNQNDLLHKETEYKTLEIDKLTQAITRLRLFDNPEVDFTIENRKNKDQRIRELEFENKRLAEDSIKAQTEYRIINERFIDTKTYQDNIIKEFTYNKNIENEQISILENRIQGMELKLDTITRENMSLRISDEKCRRELTSAIREKDNYIDKYQKKKDELNALTIRFDSLNNQFNTLLSQKMNVIEIEHQKKNESQTMIISQDNKKKIFNDLYNKIQQYKTKIKTKRNMASSNDFNAATL